jgi:hypothetical protein
VGEEVNPSAYIVNLADCMLVLACGFMVSMIAYWSIDINAVTELDAEEFEQVDPAVVPEDITSEGSSYIEAGIVYMDPSTGDLYMVKGEEGILPGTGSSSRGGSSAGNSQAAASGSTGNAGSSSSSSSTQTQDIVNARASGAD